MSEGNCILFGSSSRTTGVALLIKPLRPFSGEAEPTLRLEGESDPAMGERGDRLSFELRMIDRDRGVVCVEEVSGERVDSGEEGG